MQIYTDGRYLGKFTTRGSGKGQLDKPHGLTTDLNGFIIVADTGNYRVSIFDKYGDWKQCLAPRDLLMGNSTILIE